MGNKLKVKLLTYCWCWYWWYHHWYFQILERKNSKIHVTGADPKGSILAEPESLNNSTEGYLVEGIGYDFIPDVLNRKYVDDWIKTDDAESFKLARRIIREEGILVGGSSGSALQAALQVAKDLTEDDTVVVVFPRFHQILLV